MNTVNGPILACLILLSGCSTTPPLPPAPVVETCSEAGPLAQPVAHPSRQHATRNQDLLMLIDEYAAALSLSNERLNEVIRAIEHCEQRANGEDHDDD